ncbi:MAG TPA: hypothetical protein VGF28_01595 [Thermoanaerobaculia bacterium]|jgi:hypothetical protein
MRKLATVAACLMVLACSSAGTENTLVDVELVQLKGPAEQNFPFGRFEVQYGIRVRNRSQEPVTLHQLALEPASPGGPYVVLRDRYTLNRAVAPSATDETTLWARARATGSRDSVDAHAPVSIRAIAYFEAPSGAFRKIMMVTFR